MYSLTRDLLPSCAIRKLWCRLASCYHVITVSQIRSTDVEDLIMSLYLESGN